jgi:protein-disulfide isomerase
MKKSFFGISICALLALSACNKAVSQPKDAKTASTQTSNDKVSTLSSLSKEQQDAVKILIRDTLVSNPQILLEAQQAYEAQLSRQQNELVSKEFENLKSDGAELSFGPQNAKITMVEFFDYRCGYCHVASPWVLQQIANNKDLRVIFKELPILSPNSLVAAKAAYASKTQGKYLEFHRALMAAKGDLNLDQIMGIAQSVGLDTAKLKTDMESTKISDYLTKVKLQAENLGINGTPGFVINGKLINGFAKDELEAAFATTK